MGNNSQRTICRNFRNILRLAAAVIAVVQEVERM